ncbi:MAG: hypothetical protein EYC68_18180 [Chloroflexota bacterium]|nr:MAG: hypothetical protein EYC68_18180 [Chloroflexota bacterium]
MNYVDKFVRERSRLLAALGEMADGGRVENCQHIGATRVLEIGDCIDLAIAAYPIDDSLDAKLGELGYAPSDENPNASLKKYRHVSSAFQLFVIESGDERWLERILTRDYLLHNAAARERYASERAQWANDDARKQEFFREVWNKAQAWWIASSGFTPVENLAQELFELRAAWHIVGGWALDLFLGRVQRVHHDLDVEIAYADQLSLREYMTARGWKFVTPFEKRLEVWQPATRLEPPRHQAHAHRDGAFIDFLLSDIEGGVWRYRREPSIVQVMERISMKAEQGIPYLAPEIILLFKSRNTSGKDRSKDESDFRETLPHLEPARRAWLRWALLAADPTHTWIEYLR